MIFSDVIYIFVLKILVRDLLVLLLILVKIIRNNFLLLGVV